MKICLLNDSFPPVIDGVVNVLLNYADYLRRCHGAGIIVGTPEYPGADYDAYEYPVVAYPSLDTAAVTNGYRTGNPFSEKEISELPGIVDRDRADPEGRNGGASGHDLSHEIRYRYQALYEDQVRCG